MKLQGKAYVRKGEWGKIVCIENDTDTTVPLVIRTFTRSDGDDAENLCLSLNNWRESYAQDCIDQTISLMEEINDKATIERIAGS